ncbi:MULTISPECIES: FtsX-like permease family protein [Anaerococcus]|uniref:ABC transporter permease n=1 Tax=Anaerococcus octavius TaxID=54007 RepID=A0A2I1M983_9FIRM|nr:MULTISPECIES: FtsX-like permease family protein [Anaerococcus]MBS6106521.1 ABC transporter permease [Anaerococcus sp.]PKZ16694.1 ABC transporter permease [Anaerococcus octavius]
MRISDRFIMALRNLWRRKSRTILTILSVIIGSTSIILMLAFAQGISNSQKEMIESFQGLTSINIMDENGEGLDVNDSVINKLKNIDNVRAVVPSKNIYADFKIVDNDEYEIDGSINVIPDNMFSLLTDDMLDMGSIPNPSDTDRILLGPNTAANKTTDTGDGGYYMEPDENFDFASHEYFIRLGYKDESEDDGVNFGKEENPLDSEGKETNKPQTVDIPIKVAGKLNNTSFLNGWGSYISESTYKKLKEEDDKLAFPTLNQDFDEQGNPIKSNDKEIKYDNLQVVVDKAENVKDVEQAIRKLGYQTNSMAEASKEIESQTRTIMLILGGIGSIAFIVSAIGIINTMLMSIYERQKEIGVMKVIGASVSDIQTMFLIESGFIGFFGGVLGLLISLLAGKLINNVFTGLNEGMVGVNKIIIIPTWLALVGVGFSALVGVLAGYLPARRATKLSAIDALRAN